MTDERREYDHLVVYPHDSVLRLRVLSKSRPDIEHVVDLGSFRGNGECSCEHFEFRLRPKLIAHPGKGTRQCIHIKAAREALVDIVIDKLTDPHNGES